MEAWLAAAGAAVLFGFALSIAFGPPYVPTLHSNMNSALDMLDLKPGQTLLDLGSGDGRVLIAAAERGWSAVGIEVSPFLVLIARLRTWKYRRQVRVIWGNYFTTKWPESDGVFAFMIQRHMVRLDEHMRRYGKKPIRLASFAFHIPGRKPVQARDGVYLYEYK